MRLALISKKHILRLTLVVIGSLMILNLLGVGTAQAAIPVTCPDGFDTSFTEDGSYAEACDGHEADSGGVCSDKNDRLLGVIPKWYKYVPYHMINGRCTVNIDFSEGNFSALLPVGLAVIEILLVISGMVALVFVMFGGFQYILSQGDTGNPQSGAPNRVAMSKNTIINALIGAVVAMTAAAIVAFIGNRLG